MSILQSVSSIVLKPSLFSGFSPELLLFQFVVSSTVTPNLSANFFNVSLVIFSLFWKLLRAFLKSKSAFGKKVPVIPQL
jgi:hypothetical protein